MLPFPHGDVLSRVRDKGLLAGTVAGAGFETPASRFEASAGELRRVSFDETVVVKPARPVSSLKTARLARDPEHLRRLLEGVPDDEQLLVQERVRGPLVSVELVLDREGRLVARFQQRTQRTWPAAAGSIALATSVEPNELLIRASPGCSPSSATGVSRRWTSSRRSRVHVLLDINPASTGACRCRSRAGPTCPRCGTRSPSGRDVGGPREYRVGVTYRWLEADLVAALRGSPRRLLRRAPEPHTGPAWAAGDPMPGVLLGAWDDRPRAAPDGDRQRTK